MNREQLQHAYVQAGGNLAKTARLLGVPRTNLYHYVTRGWLDEVRSKCPQKDEPRVDGWLEVLSNEARPLPEKGNVARYLLTSAQNNTRLNDKVWKNLTVYAKHFHAEILVGTYTYNLNAYGAEAVKFGTRQETDDTLWYDERLVPFIKAGDNKNIELAPDLIWCGRANILPTAERPLSGFETYTGRSSGIFPHAKIALQSIPSGKHEKTKMNYTTGTITQRNYIQKKAGLKAEHHHTYGALIVEVCPDGTWFVRQLNADSDGVIYDLDIKVSQGRIKVGVPVLAINWGDIHTAKRDDETYRLAWGGEGSMIDTLRPKYQFMHDLLDFEARNHHNQDHQSLYERWIQGKSSVEKELRTVKDFLLEANRDWCSTIVVDSNHDNAFAKWLKYGDYRNDPENAELFLRAQLAAYDAMRHKFYFNPLEWAIRTYLGYYPNRLRFLQTDESFLIADSIECGMHGHLGPNGARGGSRALARIGRKANIGHTHSAEICDGLYVAGVSGKLDQGYNVGPSSWSHSHIVTYQNGKRSIITLSNGRWRA